MSDAAQSENPADRRRVPRIPTTLRGKVFPGAVDCIVSDLSDLGACLTFESEPVENDRLLLVIWSTGIAFDAEVRWRQGRRVGVQCISRCDFRSRTPAVFHEARAIWRRSRPKVRQAYRALRSPLVGASS